MSSDLLRPLKIKLGSVKRTFKEYQAYVKEEAQQRKKISDMEAAGRDRHDIKQQLECLNETLTVLPDALVSGWSDLNLRGLPDALVSFNWV